MTLEEERERREAALLKFESLISKFHTFIHGTEHEVVMTDNGPIKTIAAVANDLRNHETEVALFMDSISDAMEALSPVPAE